MVVNAFRSVIFPLPPNEGAGLKILTPKQIAKNTSENLLNEISQIIYALF